ncbi:MAG: molybdenum cofactor guanylyltransferase [Planctomycetota bacterium]
MVFCGGASRRMGRDKARLELEGTSLVARAAARLDEFAAEVVLASGAEVRYPETGRACVLDASDDLGPLGGLAAVLDHADHHLRARLVVLACDMPDVPPALLGRLLERARRTDADVVLPVSPSGDEPLCAVVHTRVLPAVRAALARGERRMDSFHRDCRIERLALGASEAALVRNLNTPADWLARGGTSA